MKYQTKFSKLILLLLLIVSFVAPQEQQATLNSSEEVIQDEAGNAPGLQVSDDQDINEDDYGPPLLGSDYQDDEEIYSPEDTIPAGGQQYPELGEFAEPGESYNESDFSEYQWMNGESMGEMEFNLEGFLYYQVPKVPKDSLNATDFEMENAVRLGAQYVAAQAVFEGVFYNSVHDVTKVYSAVANGPSDPEYVEYFKNLELNDKKSDIHKAGYNYEFDVEITSVYGEKLRAQYIVLVDRSGGDRMIKSYSFDFIDLADEQQVDLRVDWVVDDESYDNDGEFEYEPIEAQENEDRLETEQEDLPTLYANLPTNETFEEHGWTEVNATERLAQNDTTFEHIMYIGANYTFKQAIYNATSEYHNEPTVDLLPEDIESVFAQNLNNGTVNYRFNVIVSDQEYYTSRNIQYQVAYEDSTRTLTLRAWSLASEISYM